MFVCSSCVAGAVVVSGLYDESVCEVGYCYAVYLLYSYVFVVCSCPADCDGVAVELSPCLYFVVDLLVCCELVSELSAWYVAVWYLLCVAYSAPVDDCSGGQFVLLQLCELLCDLVQVLYGVEFACEFVLSCWCVGVLCCSCCSDVSGVFSFYDELFGVEYDLYVLCGCSG